MTTTEPAIAALVKTATVPQAPAAAFRLFTGDFGRWWPLATHSVAQQDATGATFGAGVGGQIIEVMKGGEETSWGTILAWEPPARVAFTWHPGTPVEEATSVEVTFAAEGGGTLVTLRHSGWANHPAAAAARTAYDPGWDYVVGRYVDWAATATVTDS